MKCRTTFYLTLKDIAWNNLLLKIGERILDDKSWFELSARAID